ncbi:hypothetical protein [Rarobacter incanus]|uniref:Uncharacterized protein n=1 Tax=Rarobacter incanus TaxID=153494 RepID=A0A542SQ96_9MICO|nr:hypothetical protein [Rarobacter incanus]TQK76781.1 hypothetical protein FB389_1471 [Rarobacter incanus]
MTFATTRGSRPFNQAPRALVALAALFSGLALVAPTGASGIASVSPAEPGVKAVAAPLREGTATAAPRPRAADLAMAGDSQQRWQSLAGSRLVLNSFDRYAKGDTNLTKRDTELDQTWGANLPASGMFYANDSALKLPGMIATYLAPANDGATTAQSVTLPSPFTAEQGWTTNGKVTASASGSDTIVTVNSGQNYGSLIRSITVDLDATALLAVDIAALSDGASWAFEVDGKKLMPTDSTVTGKHTYDLRALTGLTGKQALEFKIWAAGGAGKSVTVRTLKLMADDQTTNPAYGRAVLWRDRFASTDAWQSASQQATISGNGGQAIVAIKDSGKTYGSVTTEINVAVTATTKMALRVDAVTHKWSLTSYINGSSNAPNLVGGDRTDTGWVTIDLAQVVGTGQKKLDLRLFTTGARPSAVALGDAVIWDDAVASEWTPDHSLVVATETAPTWSPSAERFTASYEGGQALTGTDVFADLDAVTRRIDATGAADRILVGGITQGSMTWNPSTRQIITGTADYAQAITIPPGATVGFGNSIAGATAEQPVASDRAWAVTMDPGTVFQVGIALSPISRSQTYASNMTASSARETAAQRSAAAAAIDVAGRIADLDGAWDDFLARVPAPADFSLHETKAYGVTADSVRAAYYRAWINLEQNILPATPETNSLSRQLGTGKASGWMSGIPGAKNVATWDTLVGLQALVYADPQAAWESFTGIMNFVQPEGSAYAGEITNDPTQGGEVLPSRKAQTAWVLYNATGDRATLEEIYPALTRVLRFAKTNLHWTVKDRGIYNYDQRDSEFVTSLIIDLDYAQKISALLGKSADEAQWQSDQQYLYRKLDDWFMQSGSFVQKVKLAGNSDDDAVQQVVSAGNASVAATSLALPGLSAATRAALLDRFEGAYNGGDYQWAGLGDNLKGPNANYIVRALLDTSNVLGGATKATAFTEAIIRDVVRSGWFAEVYQGDGNGTSDKPLVDGVRPSLFGIAEFIDSVWASNGYRLSSGEPTYIRLTQDRRGGIDGLTMGGKSYALALTESGIELTGDAVDSTRPIAIPLGVGQSAGLPATLPDPEPADPGDGGGDGGNGGTTPGDGGGDGGNGGTTPGDGGGDGGNGGTTPGDGGSTGGASSTKPAVKRIKPRVKIAVKQIKRTRKVRVTVRVIAPAAKRIGGKATVKIGKSKKRTVRINAKGTGKITMKAKKRGKQRVRVAYRGTPTLKSAQASRTMRVR